MAAIAIIVMRPFFRAIPDELQAQAQTLAGHEFNLESPKQLQAVLFDELGLQAKLKTPTGQPSTNEEALEAIADTHELPRVILDYRTLAKLRSTYTDKLSSIVNPRTGRVRLEYVSPGKEKLADDEEVTTIVNPEIVEISCYKQKGVAAGTGAAATGVVAE